MNTDKPKLAIIGAYPPPYGGESNHLRRLCRLLDQRGTDYVLYNSASDAGDGKRVISVRRHRVFWLLNYMLTAKESAIYLMPNRLSTWLIGAFMAAVRGKRVMIRLRNVTLVDLVARGGLGSRLAGFALRQMVGIVCVNRHLADAAATLGVTPDRIHWSPGFLPPGDEVTDREGVAGTVWEFVGKHDPLIAANGKVGWYQGTDLYSLDHLVHLVARLKPDYPGIGLVVCFWHHDEAKDQAYLDKLMQTAADMGVAENILFNTKSGTFVPVLHAAQLFVRPTNTDGDANSIREALYLGTPAIASDVVERPEGTILFRTRDIDDFEEKVRSALKNGENRESRAAPILTPGDRERIDAYLDLLAEAGARAAGS
jgi:glycosyltransferase involved in cell wall biosynthesis